MTAKQKLTYVPRPSFRPPLELRPFFGVLGTYYRLRILRKDGVTRTWVNDIEVASFELPMAPMENP